MPIGGEGEIRTHETCEGLPVFKSGHLHVSGSHSHANAIISGVDGVSLNLRASRFRRQVQLQVQLNSHWGEQVSAPLLASNVDVGYYAYSYQHIDSY